MRSLALLAPDLAAVPSVFVTELNRVSHNGLLHQLQRLRGGLYLEDDAIEHWQLTMDERHDVPADWLSWHLLTLDDDLVTGGARLRVHARNASFSDLGVAESAQAASPMWGIALADSVSRDLERARSEGLRFVEAGGWALVPELRCTTEALHIALGGFAVGGLLGGALGLCTATVRHHSASILRRLGAGSFVWQGREVPPYYDAAYRCEMEVLRFDSRTPNPRFQPLIEGLREELLAQPVLCASVDAATSRSLRSLDHVVQGYPREAGAPLETETPL